MFVYTIIVHGDDIPSDLYEMWEQKAERFEANLHVQLGKWREIVADNMSSSGDDEEEARVGEAQGEVVQDSARSSEDEYEEQSDVEHEEQLDAPELSEGEDEDGEVQPGVQEDDGVSIGGYSSSESTVMYTDGTSSGYSSSNEPGAGEAHTGDGIRLTNVISKDVKCLRYQMEVEITRHEAISALVVGDNVVPHAKRVLERMLREGQLNRKQACGSLDREQLEQIRSDQVSSADSESSISSGSGNPQEFAYKEPSEDDEDEFPTDDHDVMKDVEAAIEADIEAGIESGMREGIELLRRQLKRPKAQQGAQ